MLKSKIWMAVLALLAVAAITAAVVIKIVSPDMFKGPYSVVSTSSGFYVGRISYNPFSSFITMRDVYMLSDVRNDKGQTVDQQLIPLAKNAVWAPSKIYINKSQILFKGVVGECSSIDRTLRTNNNCPALPQQQAQTQPSAQTPAPVSPAPKK